MTHNSIIIRSVYDEHDIDIVHYYTCICMSTVFFVRKPLYGMFTGEVLASHRFEIIISDNYMMVVMMMTMALAMLHRNIKAHIYKGFRTKNTVDIYVCMNGQYQYHVHQVSINCFELS